MRMRILLASMAVGLTAGAVQAADVYTPEPVIAAEPLPAGFDWTRFYVGANAGWAWGEFDSDLAAVAAPLAVTNAFGDANGFTGGVQAGYNFQFSPRLVAGLEADFNFTDISDDATATDGAGTTVNADADLQYLGTLTGRIGFLPAPRTMVYAKGGYAVGRVEVDATTGSDTNIHHGWTVGAGVEQAVWDSVSVRLEYGYVDLAERDFDLNLAGGDVSADFQAHTLRAGVNWLF